MTPYEDVIIRAIKPLKCGYVRCEFQYGIPPLPDDGITAMQAFEQRIIEHEMLMNHRQRRLAYA